MHLQNACVLWNLFQQLGGIFLDLVAVKVLSRRLLGSVFSQEALKLSLSSGVGSGLKQS